MILNPFRRVVKKVSGSISQNLQRTIPGIVDAVVDRVNEKYEGVLKIEFPGGILITGRIQDQSEPEVEEDLPVMKKSWE